MSNTISENYKDAILLLLEIESFAADNQIEFDSIYDLETAEKIFLHELRMVEEEASKCDEITFNIDNVSSQFFDLWLDIESLYANYIPEFKDCDLYHSRTYIECTKTYRLLMEQRKSDFLHRVWEIRTYIDACRHFKEMSMSKNRLTRLLPIAC